MRYRIAGWLAVAGALSAALAASPPDTRLRRPVALAFAAHGRQLFVANRDGGTISVIDPDTLRVVAEAPAGRRPVDLAALPGGGLLAADEGAGELLVLDTGGAVPRVRHRLAVGTAPVSVAVEAGGGRAFVACLWAHEVAVVMLPAGGPPRVERKVGLPFPPRLQLVLPGDRLLVADAFGGRLALVDTRRGAVESVRTLPAHNVRGLALGSGGKEVFLAHQVMHEETPARSDEVRWGNVVGNAVRALPLADVLRPDADLLPGSRLWTLGEFGRGAADPSGLAVAGTRVLVALGGVGEVALGPEDDHDWPRLKVGRRPTAVAVSPDGKRAVVANTFADSVSVLDPVAGKVVGEVSLGPAPPAGPAQRGEELFFDARLSADGWMSCHSCHTDGFTNGLRSDTLGDGSYGNPKRVLSLLGVGQTGPWAWNGSMVDLGTQIRQSVQTTMNGRRPAEAQVADLEAYLRDLAPPPAGPQDGPSVRHGREVFEAHGCARCHTPPTYTSPRTYDVGLADETGKGLFNPPSLRGVGHGAAFFHDNRAASLEEVFTRFRHQVGPDLPRKDVEDLVRFLRTL
jgi:YVTN family beta-propeller protein